MCGICGIVDSSGEPVGEAPIHAMLQALAHRGPDGQRVWTHADRARLASEGQEPALGFGHARLRVIDVSQAADQPMANEDGTLRLIFNGEIYNFRSLRQQLVASGHTFRSRSDSEVILHLYEERGPECVKALEGMFAFALWDHPRRRLLLARDRLGKKPLFYVQQGSRVAFASEVKALLRIIPADIDQDVVWRYFYYGYVPTPRTWYAGIRSLPPGHTMLVERDGTIVQASFWEPPVSRGEADPLSPAQVRSLVLDAVRERLVADVPLGVLLSGGIDSNVIVAAMRALGAGTIETFTMRVEGDPAFDEADAAQASARFFHTRHHEFLMGPPSLGWVDRIVWHYDGPFADSSALPAMRVAEETRRVVTVALNGDGGDETFAGYVRFAAARWADAVPASLMRAGRRVLGRVPADRSYHSRWRKAARFFDYAGRSFHERLLHDQSIFADDLERLVGAPSEGRQWDRLDALRPYLSDASMCRSKLTQALYLNLRAYLLDDLLVKMDRASMAYGLEMRSPFLDRQLVEAMAHQPDAAKLHGTKTKAILRAAFAAELPPEILRRPKRGFGVPIGRWLRGPWAGPLREVLCDPQAKLFRYVDASYVHELVEQHLKGMADYGSRLWALFLFERWLQCESAWRSRETTLAIAGGGAQIAHG